MTQKTGMGRLRELGVVSGRGKPFEPEWEPIEGVETTVEEFRDEEQDESWMDELMGRTSTSRNDGVVGQWAKTASPRVQGFSTLIHEGG